MTTRRSTSVAGANYIVHLAHDLNVERSEMRGLCGRGPDVNFGDGTEPEDGICRACWKKRATCATRGTG